MIEMVESMGFAKNKDSIKETAPYTQETSNKIHFHNHQIISPASETARFGGSAVPLRAADGGVWAHLPVTGRPPSLGFAPAPPAQGSTVHRAGAL